MIVKANELPPQDPNWRPKLRNLSVSASKFMPMASDTTKSIQSFFKYKEPAGDYDQDDDDDEQHASHSTAAQNSKGLSMWKNKDETINKSI